MAFWSMGWINDVVLDGKNFAVIKMNSNNMFPNLKDEEYCPLPGGTLESTDYTLEVFFHTQTEHFIYPLNKIDLVTYASLFALHITPNLLLITVII